MKYNFIKSTLIFCAIGFFIPGFTAILLLGIQMLLTKIGIECSVAWKIIWWITGFGMFALPFLFIKNLIINPNQNDQSLKYKLILFNFLEYIFIQAAVASLFTNGNTLCYITDGQNGLELVFTAWLALPILLVISYFFKNICERQNF